MPSPRRVIESQVLPILPVAIVAVAIVAVVAAAALEAAKGSTPSRHESLCSLRAELAGSALRGG